MLTFIIITTLRRHELNISQTIKTLGKLCQLTMQSIKSLLPRESTHVLLTSQFGSNLADFDEMFAPKWSCKDLLIESIKLLPPSLYMI